MTDFDALSDTLFREQAEKRLNAFVAEHDLPAKKITRSQIAGLLHVARQQPLKVSEFAKDKADRCKKRGDEAGVRPETQFWYLISELVEPRPNRDDWSLRGEASGRTPGECQSRNEKRAFVNSWLTSAVPLFFQQFVAHHQYLKAVRSPQAGRASHDICVGRSFEGSQ
jgi:hypothetical protein